MANPSFVSASATAELELEVPNERDAAMTGLHVSVPADFRVVAAQSDGDWLPRVTSTTVFWTGGSLGTEAMTVFRLTVEAPAGPGPASLSATQHYAGGASVRWPVEVTVLPADEPAQQLGRAIVVGIGGLLVLFALGVLFWRRRGASLQER